MSAERLDKVNWLYTPEGPEQFESWEAHEGDRAAVVYVNPYLATYSLGLWWPNGHGTGHHETLEAAQAAGERFLLADETPDAAVRRALR